MKNRPLGQFLAIAALLVPALGVNAAERYHGFQGEGPGYVPHLDARTDTLAPTAAQQQAAATLNAVVRWGQFGTPKVVTRVGQFLSGPRSGTPEQVAGAFLRDNAALFGLNAQAIDALHLLRLSPLH